MPQAWTAETEIQAIALSVAARLQSATLACAEDHDSELDPMDAFDQSVEGLTVGLVGGTHKEAIRKMFQRDLVTITCDGPAAAWFPRETYYAVPVGEAGRVKASMLEMVAGIRAWCEDELAADDDDGADADADAADDSDAADGSTGDDDDDDVEPAA